MSALSAEVIAALATGGDPTPARPPHPSLSARTHRLMAAALDLTSTLRGAWSIEQTADSTGAVLVRVRIDAADWPADFPRLLARAGGADVQTDRVSYLTITDRDGAICCYRAAVRMARGRAA